MLPRNLLFVRHTESDGNVANRKFRSFRSSWLSRFLERLGRNSFPDGFFDTPDWQRRLSNLGRRQAHLTREWLNENFSTDFFNGFHVSPFVRTREVAGLLFPNSEWKIVNTLSERDFGEHEEMSFAERLRDLKSRVLDPLFHRMGFGTGQSLHDILVSSTYWYFDTLHREYDGKNVIAVTHGERMFAIRYIMERMTPEMLAGLFQSQDKRDMMLNGQILWYTRVNPMDVDDVRDTCDWVRLLCPCYEGDGEMPDTGWREICRPKLTGNELLTQVSAYRTYF